MNITLNLCACINHNNYSNAWCMYGDNVPHVVGTALLPGLHHASIVTGIVDK